jgi:hypothetical protein
MSDIETKIPLIALGAVQNPYFSKAPLVAGINPHFRPLIPLFATN